MEEEDRSEVGEEAHEEHREAGVVLVLGDEVVEVGAASLEVVVVALLHEEEVVRGVGFHGGGVDHLYLDATACLCRYFGVSGLCIRRSRSRGFD